MRDTDQVGQHSASILSSHRCKQWCIGNAEVDFHGERLSNDTHRSTTDPEARLYRKGRRREAKLSFMAHALMDRTISRSMAP